MKSKGALLFLLGLSLMLFSNFVLNPRTLSPPFTYAVELFHPASSPSPSLPPELSSFARITGRWFYYKEEPLVSLFGLGGRGGEENKRVQEILTFSLNGRFFLVSSPSLLDEGMLASGRLPKQGKDEVVVGAGLRGIKEIRVQGKRFKVVGILHKAIYSFRKTAIAFPSEETEALFLSSKGREYRSVIFRCSSLAELEKVAKVLSKSKGKRKVDFGLFVYQKPYTPFTFFVGFLGYILLLAGGVMLIFGVFSSLKEKVKAPLLPGLEAICSHKRLYFSLNAIYFGLAILAGLFVYLSPELQFMFINLVGAEISSGKGVLAWVGRAYASGNILYAAFVTFAVNSLLGAFLWITLPSFVIPGIGLLTGCIRAILWGLLLTPASEGMALAMIPHSITALIEGEAYILAMFYAFLMAVDVYKGKGGLKDRYARGLTKNLYGFLWVLILLAIAGLYEATEVILMR